MAEILLLVWMCLRCGHKWIKRGDKIPKKCANSSHCGSAYWDKPRVRKPKRGKDEPCKP